MTQKKPKEDKLFESVEQMSKIAQDLVRRKTELAQRTWVGLTDEERKNIMIECESTGDWAWELKAAQAIEAKLKEKNSA